MSEVAKDVDKLAPTLSRGLNSGFSAQAVQFVVSRLGLDQSTVQAGAVFKAMQGEPETKLQNMEAEYRSLLAHQLGEEPGQAAKFDPKTWNIFGVNVAVILALVVVVGFFVVVFLFFKNYEVSKEDNKSNLLLLLANYKEVFIMLLGALTGVLVQVVQFFFGSSASSAGKNQLLAQQAQAPKQ